MIETIEVKIRSVSHDPITGRTHIAVDDKGHRRLNNISLCQILKIDLEIPPPNIELSEKDFKAAWYKVFGNSNTRDLSEMETHLFGGK